MLKLPCGYCEQYENMASRKRKWKKVKFFANAFLIPFENDFILFDSGYPDDLKKYNNFFINIYSKILPTSANKKTLCINQLKEKNIPLSKIKYIFISHFHIDHIGGLKNFNEAKFIYSKKEFENLKGFHKKIAKILLPEDLIKRSIYIEDFPKAEAFFNFSETYKLNSNLIAIKLCGHTKNQFGLFIKSKNIFLVADSVWHKDNFEKNILPNKFALNIMEDKKEYIKTLKKLNEIYQNNKEIEIIFSHTS